MNTLTAPPRYATADLGQAAMLVAQSFHLLRIEPAEGRRKLFLFPPEAREAGEGYYRGATVPARAFYNSPRDLKAMIAQR